MFVGNQMYIIIIIIIFTPETFSHQRFADGLSQSLSDSESPQLQNFSQYSGRSQ